MKTKHLLTYLVLLIAISAVLTVFFYQQHAKHELSETETSKIKNLLNQSRLLLGNSLNTSEKKATLALNLSQTENRPELIVESLLLLGEIECLRGNNIRALNLYMNAHELAKKTGYTRGICKATIETGSMYYIWGEYDKSLPYFQKADSIASKNDFKLQEIDALNYIGKYFRTKGNFDQSIYYFNRSLENSRKLNNYQQIALTLNHVGKYYISEGKLNLALQSYQEALKACEHFNDQIIYAEVCNHLGGLYLQIDQYKKALEYHYKALACRNVINTPEGIAKSYNNIGRAFLELKQPDSAFFYFNQSLNLCRITGYKKGTVKALTNLGTVFTNGNQLTKAKKYLQEAYEIANKAGYDLGIAESCLALGNYYLISNQYDKAKFQYLTSLDKVSKTSFDDIIHDNYLGLYKCYLATGEYQKALDYHVLLFDIKQKLLNVENNRQISMLLITFDTERKEKDNQVLRKDNELKEMTIKRKNMFMWFIIIVLGFTIVLCFLIYGRFINKRKANQTLENLNIELEKANYEKDKMYSIIAHELRNPLYWFQNLAEVLSKKYQGMTSEELQQSLFVLDESAKNAFHLMDNLLNWSRSRLKRIIPKKGNHPLSSLVNETIQMYKTIFLQKEITLQLNIPENIIVYADSDLFTCILRNLVTNAIKYTPLKGSISIECIENESQITVVVGNSGAAIPGDSIEKIFSAKSNESIPGLMNEKGSGLGLKLCKEFVELNNGKLWLTSEKGKGTRFFFTMPKANDIIRNKVNSETNGIGLMVS